MPAPTAPGTVAKDGVSATAGAAARVLAPARPSGGGRGTNAASTAPGAAPAPPAAAAAGAALVLATAASGDCTATGAVSLEAATLDPSGAALLAAAAPAAPPSTCAGASAGANSARNSTTGTRVAALALPSAVGAASRVSGSQLSRSSTGARAAAAAGALAARPGDASSSGSNHALKRCGACWAHASTSTTSSGETGREACPSGVAPAVATLEPRSSIVDRCCRSEALPRSAAPDASASVATAEPNTPSTPMDTPPLPACRASVYPADASSTALNDATRLAASGGLRTVRRANARPLVSLDASTRPRSASSATSKRHGAASGGNSRLTGVDGAARFERPFAAVGCARDLDAPSPMSLAQSPILGSCTHGRYGVCASKRHHIA